MTTLKIKLLFLYFWVTNSKSKNKKFHFKLLTWWVHFYFLNFELQKWIDKWKKSGNKGIVKICVLVDMISKNWSWIAVASCGLHYFVSACFSSFSIFANFSILNILILVERFKYMFFIAMKIHIMEWNNGYGIILQAPLYNLY